MKLEREQNMKTIPNIDQLVPVVGLDFIDKNGLRTFNFSLCENRQSGLVAIAIVDIYGDNEVTRNVTVGHLTHCRREVEAMAFEYRERSIPLTFQRTNIPTSNQV